MTRLLNFVLVALFASYFYLEYREPNAAGAVQVDATQVAKAETSADTDALIASEQPAEAVKLAHAGAAATQTDAVAAPPEVVVVNAEELQSVRSYVSARELMALPLEETVAEVSEPEPAVAPVIFRVTGSLVNARSGPGTSFDVLTKLRRGQELYATGDVEGDWAKAVVAETGEEVWMHTGFLAEAG